MCGPSGFCRLNRSYSEFLERRRVLSDAQYSTGWEEGTVRCRTLIARTANKSVWKPKL